MAKYTVQMTFETPGQLKPLKVTRRLSGRAASLRLLGADGLLAVSGAGISAESPADAAMIVVREVNQHWPKSRGPLKLGSWTAHRQRVLIGGRGNRSAWSHRWPFDDGGDDEGGSAGVREPRRPLLGPGSLHAAAQPPGPRS